MDIPSRIKLIRVRLNYTQEEFATHLSIKPTTYKNYERGDRKLSTEAITKFKACGINIDWLIDGSGNDMFAPPSKLFSTLLIEGRGDRTLDKMASLLDIPSAVLKRYEIGVEIPSEEFIDKFTLFTQNDTLKMNARLHFALGIYNSINSMKEKANQYAINNPMLTGAFTEPISEYDNTIYIDSYPEVRAAAGHGQATPTDQVIVKIAINSIDWRNYVGLDHRYIKIITVHGDSMKPSLTHGDQVFVDTAVSSFIDDAIYAIQQGDLTRFKRIKLRLDGSIEVKSDNIKEGFGIEVYSAEEASEFKLIGRVIPFKFGRFDL